MLNRRRKNKSSGGAQTRATAAKVIERVMHGASLDEPLRVALEEVPPADKPLLQQLCYGTLRNYHRLDAVLQRLLQKPLQNRNEDIHALLLCGMHQLFDMRTPDHAAISVTVDGCRVLGKEWATGLVNGVLRKCAREPEQCQAGLEPWESASHPRWLFESIGQSWPQQVDDIIAANNSHPPMCLRVNPLRTNRDEYFDALQAEGIDGAPCPLAPQGIRLHKPVDVSRLPGFAEGQVSVQDEAAQLAAELLRLPAGARVLDACAAPGGKTCHMLEKNPDIETLYAMDTDTERLNRASENLARLGLHCELLEGDGREPPAALKAESMDAILVDAPCSGAGVIRRHPDIKLLRRPEDIAGFAQTQLELLRGLWPLLRPGGELLYVTCSVLPAENEDVVRRFLEGEDSAQSLPLGVEVKAEAEVGWGQAAGAGRQLLPKADGPDGFFFSRIGKARPGKTA